MHGNVFACLSVCSLKVVWVAEWEYVFAMDFSVNVVFKCVLLYGIFLNTHDERIIFIHKILVQNICFKF